MCKQLLKSMPISNVLPRHETYKDIARKETINMAKKRSPLTNRLRYLKPVEKQANNHSQTTFENRSWEQAYRNRWQHDKVIRSTHGVNCTGSCSWNIYVKDGLVTWEGQALDYPSTGPDMPDFEPRGCPRGASFRGICSPLRVKYPMSAAFC